MDAHFRFYMAEAPSLECQRASRPFRLYYELTNSRTVDIFLKIKSLFKIFEFSTLDLLSAACGVLSELLSVVLSDLGGHLALCLHITPGSFIYSTLGLGLSIHSQLHTKTLFPDLQGTSSFSTLPLRGQTTHPYLFPPSTHCLLCLGFLHSTSQGLQTLCVYAQTSLCLEWRLEASRHGDGLCSLPYLCLCAYVHHRHWVNPYRMRSKVKENQKGRKPNRRVPRLQ